MEKVIIGQILKPQGIKGEIKVKPLTQDINRFLDVKEIFLGKDEYARAVKGCRIDGGSVFMFLDGIITRNDAEAARGLFISVKKEDAISLKEGEYFISDVIGCKIYSDGNEYLGTVINITNNGGTDVYEADNNGKRLMFPFVKKLEARVDIKNKTITVNCKAFSEVVCRED